METDHTSEEGSLLGTIFLISGCCIGAGMLGLPVLSALAGFKPSLFMFVLSWLFMMSTALLLLEVNLWFKKEVSLISMADHTLGWFGKVIAWVCFIFLFYALGVAYLSASGELISSFMSGTMGISLPNWVGSVAVSLLFGIFVYLGTRAVDHFNRWLMAGLVLSYLLLVAFGMPHVKMEYLSYKNWSMATMMLPVLILCFGFHNLVPSLTTYLNGNVKKLRLAIVLGSSIPLLIYLVWEWLILGIVPAHGHEGFLEAIDESNMATEMLKNAVGSHHVVVIAQYFAFFAILTSFLGNSLSFVDFLADGLSIKKDHKGKLCLCFFVIVPSLLLALAYPRIFLTALSYAGAFGAVTLFGILPAMMAWSGRYYKKFDKLRLVPGGKPVLAVVFIFAIGIMAMQLMEFFGK